MMPSMRVLTQAFRPRNILCPSRAVGHSLYSARQVRKVINVGATALANEKKRYGKTTHNASLICQSRARPISTSAEASDVIQQTGEAVLPTSVVDKVVKVGPIHIPKIWLRDNCQCGECVHQETKQRLLDTFKIPRDIDIASCQTHDEGMTIEWSDGHKSHYNDHFLQETTKSFHQRAKVRQGLRSITPWGAEIKENPPAVDFHPQSLQSTSRRHSLLLPLLDQIREYGFCFVDHVPTENPNTTAEILQQIAFIRETHYGGFYDFTADLASKDTAYTSIALEAHTDNTYFSDPAGLQAFHLLSHTDGDGGASLLVDGFKVAADLQAQDPEAYKILSTVNIHAHASGNEGISIQPYRGFPVLQHDPKTGDLLQVRWNSSDRAGIELPISEVEQWYDAARKWSDLLKKEENEYWEQLTPGRLLIFDNWRVLHGRSAFTGKRRICGAYINRDDWISKYKMLKMGHDEVLDNLPSS